MPAANEYLCDFTNVFVLHGTTLFAVHYQFSVCSAFISSPKCYESELNFNASSLFPLYSVFVVSGFCCCSTGNLGLVLSNTNYRE